MQFARALVRCVFCSCMHPRAEQAGTQCAEGRGGRYCSPLSQRNSAITAVCAMPPSVRMEDAGSLEDEDMSQAGSSKPSSELDDEEEDSCLVDDLDPCAPGPSSSAGRGYTIINSETIAKHQVTRLCSCCRHRAPCTQGNATPGLLPCACAVTRGRRTAAQHTNSPALLRMRTVSGRCS